MADDKEKLIEQFSSVSGFDAERSKFYLESAAWDIETALSSLYEDDEGNSSNTPAEERGNGEKPADMPKIGLVDSDSSDEEGQAFYAGGSEHSGQQVIGPSRKKKDVVSRLFKSAKKHGAEVLESGRESGSSSAQNVKFSGMGYKLGETDSDHEIVSQPLPKEDKPKDVTLKMWKTGFSVDDGPLRAYEDPANHEFLNSVKRGQVPLELIKSAKGGEVYINMEDHRTEEFVAPKINRVPFTGSGQALGSPAPTIIGASGSGGAVHGASSADNDLREKSAKDHLNIDSSKPVTSVQLRLPDGSRLILKLNHNHTVGDVRTFLSSARPSIPSNFSLMTTFPHAELKDNSKTLAEANILNAVLVVK